MAGPIASGNTSMEIDRTGNNIGPIWLVPGVSYLNVYTLLFAAFVSIGLNSFLNAFQPYILEVNLQIPAGTASRARSARASPQVNLASFKRL